MPEKLLRHLLSATIVSVLAGISYAVFLADRDASSSLSLSTPAGASRVVDAFEAVGGRHPGFRRNHAKGLCVTGYFEANGQGGELSTAIFFRQGRYPVIGRLSTVGGDPSVNDTRGRLRSLALHLKAAGETWRMALNSIPMFFVNTPQALLEQLQAAVPEPGAHGANPEKMNAFRRAHPESQPFEDWMDTHRPSSRFDNAAYYSVNAFRFLNAEGHAQLVRWRMEPDTPYAPMSDEQIEHNDPDMLSYSLVSRLAEGPMRWHLIVTLALPDDPVNDATQRWSRAGHREIDTGVLVVDQQQPQMDGPCRDVDFNPLMLPTGIQPSDDPLLLARGAAYAESHRRRVEEAGGQ